MLPPTGSSPWSASRFLLLLLLLIIITTGTAAVAKRTPAKQGVIIAVTTLEPYVKVMGHFPSGTLWSKALNATGREKQDPVNFPIVSQLADSAGVFSDFEVTWMIFDNQDEMVRAVQNDGIGADMAFPVKAGVMLANMTGAAVAGTNARDLFATPMAILYVPMRVVDFVVVSLDDLAKLWAAFLALLACVCGTGITFWLAEHGRNEPEFRGPPWAPRWIFGMLSGAWFSVATISTVGYGDKTPKTWTGRLAAVLIVIAGLIISSLLSGTVVSSLTTLSGTNMDPETLLNRGNSFPVGLLQHSTGQGTLDQSQGLAGSHPTTVYANISAGCADLMGGGISALIADALEVSQCQHLAAKDPGFTQAMSSLRFTSSEAYEPYEIVYDESFFARAAGSASKADKEMTINLLTDAISRIVRTGSPYIGSATASVNGDGTATTAGSDQTASIHLESSAAYCATTMSVVLLVTFAANLFVLVIRVITDFARTGRCRIGRSARTTSISGEDGSDDGGGDGNDSSSGGGGGGGGGGRSHRRRNHHCDGDDYDDGNSGGHGRGHYFQDKPHHGRMASQNGQELSPTSSSWLQEGGASLKESLLGSAAIVMDPPLAGSRSRTSNRRGDIGAGGDGRGGDRDLQVLLSKHNEQRAALQEAQASELQSFLAMRLKNGGK